MNNTIKLLLTISGGLEDLAEIQIQSYFRDVLLNFSCYRRTSGSQVYMDLHCADNMITDIIVHAVKEFDYIEYAYVLLDSINIPHTNSDVSRAYILRSIFQATSNIPKTSVDLCESICNSVYSNVDVGLSSLPGLILSTPEIHIQESFDGHNPSCESFAVNSIYTQKDVSKAVVEKVTSFIHQYDSCCNGDECLWVDAGSGDGSLLENLPPLRSLGVDTHPTSHNIHRADYLDLTKDWLQEKSHYQKLYIITNPPFSVSSRGDYTPIISFINHSFDVLEAEFVAVIAPSKFARERIWASLELSKKAHLWARFLLPQDSFYDPATGNAVHIHSFCLIFGNRKMPTSNDVDAEIILKSGCHITAKRDKGSFREISTADLTSCIVSGFATTGMELVAERYAKYFLNAKLLESSFELWWQLNPAQPCSAVNSNCAKIPSHSMGWISLSVKPAVALAMSEYAINIHGDNYSSCIAVNSMCGEGTIELESSRAARDPVFIISGDIRSDCTLKASKRVAELRANSNCRPLVDFVVWDAQNLPLRKGFADVVFGDLPIQGATKKVHQQPKIGNTVASSAINYLQVLGEASRLLKPRGIAAFISVDFRSLNAACKKFNWLLLKDGASFNLGGLTGKLHIMRRKESCTKDLCLTVPPGSIDYSSWLLDIANRALENTGLDCRQKIHHVIKRVELLNTFFHPEKRYLRHCYRFIFHDEIRNADAKALEKIVRKDVKNNLLDGMSL